MPEVQKINLDGTVIEIIDQVARNKIIQLEEDIDDKINAAIDAVMNEEF